MQPFAATRESLASIVAAGRITLPMVPKSLFAASGMNSFRAPAGKASQDTGRLGWTAGRSGPNLGR